MKIEDILKKYRTKRILFVGTGNMLRGDDAAGLYIISELKKIKDLPIVYAEGGIENYIGKIAKHRPEIIFIFDAVHLKEKPGTVRIFPLNYAADYSMLAHNFSMEMLLEIFSFLNISEIYMIGIQPENLKIGKGMSEAVIKSADKIINEIKNSLINTDT